MPGEQKYDWHLPFLSLLQSRSLWQHHEAQLLAVRAHKHIWLLRLSLTQVCEFCITFLHQRTIEQWNELFILFIFRNNNTCFFRYPLTISGQNLAGFSFDFAVEIFANCRFRQHCFCNVK